MDVERRKSLPLVFSDHGRENLCSLALKRVKRPTTPDRPRVRAPFILAARLPARERGKDFFGASGVAPRRP